jgi:hypothetical protein
MHETTKLNIEKMNEKYRIAASKGHKEVKLEPGDLVWLHLRKEWFPELRKSKLTSRAAGPFKILAKINDNAYKLELPPEFRVSPSFNISDLRPYLGEEYEMPSRMTSMQGGDDDEDVNTSATIIPSVEILDSRMSPDLLRGTNPKNGFMTGTVSQRRKRRGNS